MNTIVFPRKTDQRYYDIHYRYILNIFMELHMHVLFEDLKPHSETSFVCYIDGEEIIFDFADDAKIDNIRDKKGFKLHYSSLHPLSTQRVFPFTPVSFYNWSDYRFLSEKLEYTAGTDLILNKQRPYANAVTRRTFVQQLLANTYGKNVDISYTDAQKIFWFKITKCLVSVHVPGYRNNMIDRSQLELMAFGCCTISPSLPELLPFKKTFLPGIHYVCCSDDYSDLLSLIEWCKSHRKECREIGQNAKQLFRETSTPDTLKEWMIACLDENAFSPAG